MKMAREERDQKCFPSNEIFHRSVRFSFEPNEYPISSYVTRSYFLRLLEFQQFLESCVVYTTYVFSCFHSQDVSFCRGKKRKEEKEEEKKIGIPCTSS